MIKLAEPDAVMFVVNNMREKDQEEIYALRTEKQQMVIANEVLYASEHGGIAFVAHNEAGVPVCVFGGLEKWQNVWDMFMFATDDFDDVAVEVTRFIKKRLIGMILKTGAHRAECMSLATHSQAHAWLKYFGFERESVAKMYGKNGEDFYCFSWLRKAD